MRLRSKSHDRNLKTIKTAAGAAIRGLAGVSHSLSFRRRLRASLTVEAALILPLMMGFLLMMAAMLRAVRTCEAIDVSLCAAARRAAAWSESREGVHAGKAALFFYEHIRESRADLSMVRGGMAGIRVRLVRDGTQTGIIRLEASCLLRIGGLVLPAKNLPVRDSICVRAWTGLPHTGLAGEDGAEGGGQTVLVAENGTVYHRDDSCTYLQLSVRAVPAASLDSLRSRDGSRYVPCQKCGGGHPEGLVYIAEQGEAWHSRRSCSGLKREFKVLGEESARQAGLHACPRCGSP